MSLFLSDIALGFFSLTINSFTIVRCLSAGFKKETTIHLHSIFPVAVFTWSCSGSFKVVSLDITL